MKFNRFEWLNSWVDGGGLPAGAVAVLCVLFRYMDEGGRAWPSITTIINSSGCSRSSVIRFIQICEDIGWISKQKRSGKSTVYLASFPHKPVSQGHQCHTDTSVTDTLPDPCHTDTSITLTPPPVSQGHHTSVTLTPKQNKNRTNNIPMAVVEAENSEQEPETTTTTTAFDPSVFVMELLSDYDLNLSIQHSGMVWGRVRQILDSEQSKRYLAHKIADLALMDPKPAQRQLFNWLCNDAADWLERTGAMALGRNEYQAPEIETPEPEPAYTDIDHYEHPPELAEALETLKGRFTGTTAEQIQSLRWVRREGNVVTLRASDEFYAMWLMDNYSEAISKELSAEVQII